MHSCIYVILMIYRPKKNNGDLCEAFKGLLTMLFVCSNVSNLSLWMCHIRKQNQSINQNDAVERFGMAPANDVVLPSRGGGGARAGLLQHGMTTHVTRTTRVPYERTDLYAAAWRIPRLIGRGLCYPIAVFIVCLSSQRAEKTHRNRRGRMHGVSSPNSWCQAPDPADGLCS